LDFGGACRADCTTIQQSGACYSYRSLGLNFFDLGQFNPDSHKQRRKGISSLKNQSIRLFHGGALLAVWGAKKMAELASQ
jgi:hypothetical protein